MVRRDKTSSLSTRSAARKRGELRAALEQQRLDALGGERVQLLLEWPRPETSRSSPAGSVRPRRAAAAGLSAYTLRAVSGRRSTGRAAADGDRVHRRAQLVHAAAGLLAGDPALGSAHWDREQRRPPVERHRRLVDDEGAAARDPRPPCLLFWSARLEGVLQPDVDPGLAQAFQPPPAARGSGRAATADRATPAAGTRSTTAGSCRGAGTAPSSVQGPPRLHPRRVERHDSPWRPP